MHRASRPFRAVRPAIVTTLAAICLIWPGLAAAAPQAAPVKWSPELGPVPGALTHTAPALANVSTGKKSSSLLLFWTGPADGSAGFHISYQTSLSLRKNTWSRPNLVAFGKALTRSRPAASPIGPQSSGQVIVAWKDPADSRILYAIGHEGKGGIGSWSAVAPIPQAAAASAPSVFRPLHSNLIVVTWQAASGRAVDYIVGIPSPAGPVKWEQGGSIPRSAATGTPAIAEVSTGSQKGLLYVLWQVPGSSGQVDYATAPEPVRGQAKWSFPHALPPSVRTGAPPSAQAIGKGLTYPLLVVFRAQHGAALSYVTLSAKGKVTKPVPVPHIRSSSGTAISPGVLAAEDPDDVFYEPFVRPCPAC
ncbi:MAG TPA: hypothetical protein VN767_24415 [Streptosporangiaceae bacterium]|nr:hypothetical protein [Streptosporangiaceae bacterium]